MAAMKRVSLSRRTVNLRSQSVAATQASRLAIRWHGNMESPDCSIAQNEPLSYRGARQLLRRLQGEAGQKALKLLGVGACNPYGHRFHSMVA